MRLRALLCVLAASIAGAVPTVAGATNAPVTINLTWRLVTRNIGSLFGDGRYVGYLSYAAPNQPFVVIDDLTGRRTRIDTLGCDAQAMSATWVAFDVCSDQVNDFRL
jgi:hypothetical protein